MLDCECGLPPRQTACTTSRKGLGVKIQEHVENIMKLGFPNLFSNSMVLKQSCFCSLPGSWRLQEGSSNEKRVLPRRYLFFSKWWLWEGSSDKKRVLLRRYLFFSKFTNVHHLQWNQPCCIELKKICININYDGYCLNWSYLLFRLLYCPTVSQRWEERTPELLLQKYWMRFW